MNKENSEPLKRELRLNLFHKPGNVLQKEQVELRIIDVTRSKETALQIMKAALDNPKNIQLELNIKDRLMLAAQIKELEKENDQSTN